MTRLRWFIVWSGLLALATSVHGGGEGKGKLEGTWIAEKDGKKVFELVFEKGRFTATARGKVLKGTYKTDPSKTPHEMDMTFKDTDRRIDGKVGLAIYELSGDTLKWAANDPARGNPRPKEFPEKDRQDGDYIYLILKRAGK